MVTITEQKRVIGYAEKWESIEELYYSVSESVVFFAAVPAAIEAAELVLADSNSLFPNCVPRETY